jgi:hypothetical protein
MGGWIFPSAFFDAQAMRVPFSRNGPWSRRRVSGLILCPPVGIGTNQTFPCHDPLFPLVIGRLCWEFPAMVPSDWEAQNLHGADNAITVRDWKAALDGVVLNFETIWMSLSVPGCH